MTPDAKRICRSLRFLSGLIAAAVAALFIAAGAANAGEYKSFDPKYINGKCQNSPLDYDC